MSEFTVSYGQLRTDKPEQPGFSAELIPNDLEPEFWDSFAYPEHSGSNKTLLDYFEHNAAEKPDYPFLGYREKLADGYGDYKWISR